MATEPAGKGYALWLMPEEPMFSLLADRIFRLSEALSTPLFEPHITLLSGIIAPEEAAVAKSAALARVLVPLRIELGNIEHTNEYFRCLFVSVKPTDSLIKARRTARETFGFLDEGDYMPHLSLLYGKPFVEAKKEITAAHGDLSGRTFEVRRLTLYRVDGAPHQWLCVRKFDLGEG